MVGNRNLKVKDSNALEFFAMPMVENKHGLEYADRFCFIAWHRGGGGSDYISYR